MNLNQKYRPKTFDEVCGQTITTTILKKVIENRSFKNCYLFSGKTGSGKTTCARIFANEINNGVGSPIEIDAASNSGVDNVRAIVDSANQRALTGEYKIFIIDECHSLTSQAWQAFLKGIEETPKYTIFIFCTTEPQKVPATILNRVQRFNFTPISQDKIKDRLSYICQQEGFINYEQTCELISKTCFGSARDAITTLEKCADYSKDLSIDVIKSILNNVSYETMFKLTWALQNKKEEDLLSIIEELHNDGQDLKQFISVYLEFILDIIKYTLFKDIKLTSIPAYLASDDNAVVQFTVSKENSLEYFNKLVDALFDLKSVIKLDSEYKSTIEVLLIRFCREN